MYSRHVSHRLIVLLGSLSFLASLTGCKESDLVCIGKSEEIQIGMRLTSGTIQELGGEADDIATQILITRIPG